MIALARPEQRFLPIGLMAWQVDGDFVLAGRDVEPLEDAVELIRDAYEVAVDVDLGLARLDLDPRAGPARGRSKSRGTGG